MVVRSRGIGGAAIVLAVSLPAVLLPVSARAYQIVQEMRQAEARDSAGKVTVEASISHVVACSSANENGGRYYIYQYVHRQAFRAILPPHWGNAIGGRDFGKFEEAVAAACRQGNADDEFGGT
jgi:hypothetical protein